MPAYWWVRTLDENEVARMLFRKGSSKGRRTSGLLDRVNLGAVLSVMLRLVMNPEGCAECLWHVEMWANTKIMVGPANWHYYLVLFSEKLWLLAETVGMAEPKRR